MNNLARMRIEQCLKQSDLLELLIDCNSKTCLSMIENGHAMPTIRDMKVLCQTFRCSPSDLFSYEELDLSFGGDNEECVRFDIDKHSLDEFNDCLASVGYDSANEWFREMFRKLKSDRALNELTKNGV